MSAAEATEPEQPRATPVPDSSPRKKQDGGEDKARTSYAPVAKDEQGSNPQTALQSGLVDRF